MSESIIDKALNMYRMLDEKQVSYLTKLGYSVGERIPGDLIRSILIQWSYREIEFLESAKLFEELKTAITCKSNLNSVSR